MADKVKKVRGPRKKSQRSQGKRTISAASARLKELWQDPEFRARMKKRDEDRARLRKEHPERFGRAGVPDGMRKRDALPLWDRAHKLADRFIKIMKDVGELPAEEHVEIEGELIAIPTSDAGKAEAAMREAFVLAVGPSTQQIKIQAINTVLAYTKSKPESKSKLTLNKAEDFLDAVANDMKQNDGAD